MVRLGDGTCSTQSNFVDHAGASGFGSFNKVLGFGAALRVQKKRIHSNPICILNLSVCKFCT